MPIWALCINYKFYQRNTLKSWIKQMAFNNLKMSDISVAISQLTTLSQYWLTQNFPPDLNCMLKHAK